MIWAIILGILIISFFSIALFQEIQSNKEINEGL